MQELSDAEVAARDGIPPSDTVRVRFGEIDGLRAIAIVTAVIYAGTRAASPSGDWPPALARVFADCSQGIALFFVISGFVLAYPIFATLREDGMTYIDGGRYLLKRALRIYPAYLAVLALTLLIPLAAKQYGLPALAAGASSGGWSALWSNAFFAGSGLGNDAFRVLALEARWCLVFPLLAVVWSRWPRAYAGGVLLVALADTFWGAAHAAGLGSLVPFMLGIVAADVRAGHHRIERVAFPIAGVAFALALLLEPFAASAAGVAHAPGALRIDPLWALAFGALLVGAGTSSIVERMLGLPPFRLLGAASYGIGLVTVPVSAFVVRQTFIAFGAGAAAANAVLASIVAGFIVWQLADRWFAAGTLRRDVADRVGPVVDALLRPFRADRIVLGRRARLVDETPEPDGIVDTAFYAPPPRPASGDVPVLSTRSGSAEDLAAEILDMKRRLSERSSAIFADAEPAPEPVPEEPEPEPVFSKPGFYRKGSAQTSSATSSAPSARAPVAPAATTPLPALPAFIAPPVDAPHAQPAYEHFSLTSAGSASHAATVTAPQAAPPSTRGPIKMRLAPAAETTPQTKDIV